MFPNVRLLIAAVVASVVALSCGFAMFATFRVNHAPLSRLATGAAPLQLAAGNPITSVAMPTAAELFGSRFPLNNGDVAGASVQVAPPQPKRDDSVEPPSAVATTATITTTGPETEPAEPAQPAPVAQAPAAEPVAQIPEPDAKPNEVAATTPSEPAAGRAPPARRTCATAPIEAPAALRRRLRQRSRRQSKLCPPSQPRPRNKPAKNPTKNPIPTPQQRLRPNRHLRRPPERPPTGTALLPRRSALAKHARSPQPSASQPVSVARSWRRRATLPPGRNAPAKPARPSSRSASLQVSAPHSYRRRAIERRPIFGVGLMAARAETT